ncbi:MAG: hypothetical protein JW842_11495 [Prolixibacteraceae bacterium]|nr:hypothetical protein [Prolixibacteraceae bacterium]
MKKSKLLLMISFMLFMFVAVLPACDDDDDGKEDPVVVETKPIKGTNFDASVTANTITFTTTLTGNVWFTNKATTTTYPVVDGKVTVFIATKGDYVFTCSILVSGETKVSDEFTVKIESDDLSFLDDAPWKYLSGGVGKTKTWRLDMNAEGKCVYFEGPLYYSGDNSSPYWAWEVLESQLPYTLEGVANPMASFFNWSPDYAGNTWIMAAQDYGTIKFSGNDFKASTVKFGVNEDGSFTFDPATMMLKLSGVTLPTDTARFNEGQVVEWGDIRVFSISDSAMQLGLKRVYEGKDDNGAKKESKWTLVYNFVVVGYKYKPAEEFTYEKPIKTAFTATDLVGTWKYAPDAQNWVNYKANGNQGTINEPALLNGWTTREDMLTVLASWNNNDVSVFDNIDALEFVFNADGTCNLAGIANTYTVENGVIKFGTDLTTEISLLWMTFAGKEVDVINVSLISSADGNVVYSNAGIWLGQQNADKKEYNAVHLVKK